MVSVSGGFIVKYYFLVNPTWTGRNNAADCCPEYCLCQLLADGFWSNGYHAEPLLVFL